MVAAIPLSAKAAKYQTANFLVTARDAHTAKQVGQYAEHFRRQKALEWIGTEMTTWQDPCTIEVRVTYGGAGGATSFAFDNGQILGQSMVVEGPLERILNSVLPHEITHTVFAYKFRRPLPRWADEGGAVLSEDQQEIARHDLMVRELIRGGRMIPLARLFVLTEYPRDVMALYAQGFSVANFLVSQKGRGQYLDFVWEGQLGGWERAVRQHYGYRNIAELEKRWIDWLIAGRGTGADGPPMLAGEFASPRSNRVVRGSMPDDGFDPPIKSATRGGDDYAAAAPSAGRSGWLPSSPTPVGVGGRSAIPPAEPVEPYGRSTYGNEAAGYRGFESAAANVPKGPPTAAAVGNATASRDTADELDPPADRVPRKIIPIAVGRTRRS